VDLPADEVHRILAKKDVDALHHANSVITACQFLRAGALLSRGTVARRGLYQTTQVSGESDKKLGLWFDVFADFVNIHERARRANAYGPVLFVPDIALVAKGDTGRIWVTKSNPLGWLNQPEAGCWFSSISDLDQDFRRGSFDQMLVFRHCGGEPPFVGHLKEIILDDPC
jgi:hypothetical protein